MVMENGTASAPAEEVERKGAYTGSSVDSKTPTAPKPSSPRIPVLLLQVAFPATLLLGTFVSIFSPLGSSPSYFRSKRNLFNVYFVKYGWFWTTLAALFHISRIPSSQQIKAVARYSLATLHWILVTQWFFGPPLMDRVFVFTGGVCEISAAAGDADSGVKGTAERIVASAACRLAKGRWTGGHDLSGHVFLLTHASLYLMSELWPVLARQGYRGWQTKTVLGVVGLWWWMLLMTSLYFHTWVEKFTGIIAAYVEWYAVYVLVGAYPQIREWLSL